MNRRKKGWTVVLAALAAVALSMPAAAVYTGDLTDPGKPAAAEASSAYTDPTYGELSADRAFDNRVNDYDTYWGSGQTVDATHPEWVSYNFGYGGGPPRVITRYRIHTGPPDEPPPADVTHSWYIPDVWTFEGSDDGSSWTVLHTQLDANPNLALNDWSPYYNVANTTAYYYYRISVTGVETGWGGTYVDISEIEMMAEGYVVYGTVTDGTNPVPGVTITFSHDAHTETTAADGTYYYAVAVGATTTITPSHAGYIGWSPASRTINNIAADAPNQDFVGTPQEPEIDVQRPAGAGNSIADGGTDNVGNQTVGTVNLTYTIDNSAGTAQLTIPAGGATASNYVNSSGFSVGTALPLNVAAGATGTLQVSFNVPINGAFSLDVDIANNDGNENPYDIEVTGTGTGGAPEIDVQRPAGTSIADGGTDNVGNQTVGTVNLTYTIDNSAGTAQLTIPAGGATASNYVNSSGFSVGTALPLNVAAGGTATLNVSFDVDANGAFSLDVDIANNDSNENPYDIEVTGTGTGGAPEIDVQRPAGTSIADGGTDNVGNQTVGTVNLTYTIDNTAGTDQLSVTGVTACNLSNVSNFSLDTATPINVAAGATATFDISFDVDTNGAFSLDLDIDSNDADENPYDIEITGTGGGGAQGDVDGDGTIDAIDARLCLQIATGILTGTAAEREAADVDGDGDVDMDDVTILSEYILGIRTTLP